jgi:hypothetical protein
MITSALKSKLKRKISFYEDEITSCIFGEMKHIDPNIIWKIFRRLIISTGIQSDYWNDYVPTNVQFKFWNRNNNVEPDIILHFFKDDKIYLNIIIEVKWKSPIFPKCELVRQWNNRNIIDSSNWLHFYLVKNKAVGFRDITNSLSIAKDQCNSKRHCSMCECGIRIFKEKYYVDDWENRLCCISWNDISYAVNAVRSDAPDFSIGIVNFLEKQGVNIFTGYSTIEKAAAFPDKEIASFFSKDPWFKFNSKPNISEKALGLPDVGKASFFTKDPWFKFNGKINISLDKAKYKHFFQKTKQD